MRLFDTLLTSPAIHMFGWALLHSLWQGFILALLLKGVLNFSKKISANTRYLLACVTLLLMLMLPVLTALLWSNSGTTGADPVKTERQATQPLEEATSSEIPTRVILSETGAAQQQQEPPYKLWMQQAERYFMPWAVLVWSFGVFLSSLRLLGVWTYTQRLKLIEKHLVLDEWRETLQKLSRQLRVSRPVILLESSLVKVPTVVGWLKPVVLIPSCALTGLTPQQFELILAHELAHIRRHDYLVNLFQTIIETFLFYHPAAWWASNQIRNERENACDDLAVGVGGGNAIIYARTLIEMERLRKRTPSLAMAADGGSLTNRIHRLVGVEMSASKRFAGLWVVILISVFMVTVGVTKQNSTVIKERVGDVLSSGLSALTNSEPSQAAAGKSSKQQVADENQKNKNTAEESTKILSPSQPEPDLNVKPEGAKEDVNTESDQEPVEIAQQQAPEAMPVPGQQMTAASVQSGPSPDNTSETEGAPDSQINIKYQLENNRARQDGSQDFIEEMASVGYTNLTIDELVNLKAVGVTASFVRGLRAAGFNNLTVKELVNARAVGVTPAFIEGIRGAGYKDLTLKELVNFRALDVTPERIGKYRNAGYDNLPVKNLIEFAAHNITADFIKSMNGIGFGKLSPKELVLLRVFNITPGFVQTARNRLGNDLTIKQIVDLKNTGILKDKDKDDQ